MLASEPIQTIFSSSTKIELAPSNVSAEAGMTYADAPARVPTPEVVNNVLDTKLIRNPRMGMERISIKVI